MDWSPHFPAYASQIAAGEKRVEFADIGCGFGGLLMALAPMFPDTLMLGELYWTELSAAIARFWATHREGGKEYRG